MSQEPPATRNGLREDSDRHRPVRVTMAWKDILNPEGFVGRLFARGIWQFAGTLENKGFDDPVYKKNLQRLIERNRAFEEARKGKS